jgi:hypothetical protein
VCPTQPAVTTLLLLLLPPVRFNLTLGERLIEHLKNWLDPDTLLQAGPFQWKSGAAMPFYYCFIYVDQFICHCAFINVLQHARLLQAGPFHWKSGAAITV